MLEIELKFAVTTHDAIRQQIVTLWQPVELGIRQEEDHYFNAPDRDFAQTGEALRIRFVDPQATLTYKGPKEKGEVKTREEIEVPLAAGKEHLDRQRAMLLALGYRLVAIVRKKREMFEVQRNSFSLQICLDELESLGQFVEIEVLASAETRYAAQAVVRQTALELGLEMIEPRSYLRLFLEKAGWNR